MGGVVLEVDQSATLGGEGGNDGREDGAQKLEPADP